MDAHQTRSALMTIASHIENGDADIALALMRAAIHSITDDIEAEKSEHSYQHGRQP